MANPAFSHAQRQLLQQQLAARSWFVEVPNPFLGGRQPLAPRKFPPSLLSVDSPPAYLPEIIVLGPEDPGPTYFTAQRWPHQKIIVSVDNPPVQDDERVAEIAQTILATWNAPGPPYPQAQRKIAAITGVTAATGALSSAGVGTDFWVGASQQNTAPKLLLQTHIIRAWDVPASILQRRPTLPQVTATSATGDISSAGVATDVWTSASAATSSLSALGAGTATWVGSSAQNTAPRAVIQNQIIAAWVPQQLLLQPRRFLPQIPATPGTGAFSSVGLGLATWVGAETATASFLGTGQATATFIGRTAAVTTRRFDGWRPRAQLLEQRRRKDEQEIMAILAAVLPLVQSGTVRAPTRISVPQNVRTLQ